jgi:hypothetical protein
MNSHRVCAHWITADLRVRSLSVKYLKWRYMAVFHGLSVASFTGII